jgi:hypothetical protein
MQQAELVGQAEQQAEATPILPVASVQADLVQTGELAATVPTAEQVVSQMRLELAQLVIPPVEAVLEEVTT